MNSAKIKYGTVELIKPEVKKIWQRKISTPFYIKEENKRLIVTVEEEITKNKRKYLVYQDYEIDTDRGSLKKLSRKVEIPPVYIKRNNKWIVEVLNDEGNILWTYEYNNGDISVTCVGDLLFIFNLMDEIGVVDLYNLRTGEKIWTLRHKYSTDFFITSFGNDNSIKMSNLLWYYDNRNSVDTTPASRLIFLEVLSDPFYEQNDRGTSEIKDEIYAIDTVEGTILWSEKHDIIETREVKDGIIITTIDELDEGEKCIVRCISSKGFIKWSKNYSSYVRILSSEKLVALESNNYLEVIELGTGKRLFSLSKIGKYSGNVERVYNDKVIVEEYNPERGRHALKCYDINGETLWELYLSPESEGLIYLDQEGNYGAIYIRGRIYLISLSNGKIINRLKVKNVTLLSLKYPFLVVNMKDSRSTIIYDTISLKELLTFNNFLKSDDIFLHDDKLIVTMKSENKIIGYKFTRKCIKCRYPTEVQLKPNEEAEIVYLINNKKADLEIIEKPPICSDYSKYIDGDNKLLKIKLAATDAVGLYHMVVKAKYKDVSKELITYINIQKE